MTKLVPLSMNAGLRLEPDKSYTIVVEISGIPDIEAANRVSAWLRSAIRENAAELSRPDAPPSQH
jgi:hypothetical protein